MNSIKLIYIVLCLSFLFGIDANTSPKIAVIGGGIGGTSCAYFLNEVFGGKAAVTLFERDLIGGRLQLVSIDGNQYESGGSIIHQKNKYMVEFAELLKLEVKKVSSSTFGIYDGSKFVIEESDWYMMSVLKFLWRYGMSVISIWRDVKLMLSEFSKIYVAQDQGYSFTTVTGMLDYMNKDFKNMTQISLLTELEKESYSKTCLDELVQSMMMVNYGQTNNISAFAGFVALAGADSRLWSVNGGNKQVPEGLLKKSKASFIRANVSEVILKEDGTYSVKYIETFSESKTVLTADYDIVIIANPLIKGQHNIQFTNFKKNMNKYETTFHRTVATFIKGLLKPDAFDAEKVPDEILVCKPNSVFNSIGRLSAVKNPSKNSPRTVFKVFSSEPLMIEQIHGLFQSVEVIKEKDWLAYPHYNPPENLHPFMLYPGLYYINAIEQAASAMEMSTIAAKNVALLAYNLWHNDFEKVDYFKRVFKEEL